jgi:hypothetical protein
VALELEVLLRLLESVDRLTTYGEIVYNRHLFRSRHTGLLAVIPMPELPAWHALKSGDDLFDVVFSDVTERSVMRAQYGKADSWAADDRLARRLRPRLAAVLVDDVRRAIDSRLAVSRSE